MTGILSGSLQKVTIDRVLRLVEALGLEAEIKVRRAFLVLDLRTESI